MATNFKQKSNKLYFDVQLPNTRVSQSFLCTQFTAGSVGDRYGCLLKELENCTGSTPAFIKRSRAVSAWFSPTDIAGANATTPLGAVSFDVAFVQPTANGNNLTLTKLSYLTVGGTAVANKIGNEAIYGTAGSIRHFSVQVVKNRGAAGLSAAEGGAITAHGVLYVQRQHSIEV